MRCPSGVLAPASILAKTTNGIIENGSQFSREYHEVTGDIICPSMVMGIDHLRDPRLNKVSIYSCFIKI